MIVVTDNGDSDNGGNKTNYNNKDVRYASNQL